MILSDSENAIRQRTTGTEIEVWQGATRTSDKFSIRTELRENACGLVIMKADKSRRMLGSIRLFNPSVEPDENVFTEATQWLLQDEDGENPGYQDGRPQFTIEDYVEYFYLPDSKFASAKEKKKMKEMEEAMKKEEEEYEEMSSGKTDKPLAKQSDKDKESNKKSSKKTRRADGNVDDKGDAKDDGKADGVSPAKVEIEFWVPKVQPIKHINGKTYNYEERITKFKKEFEEMIKPWGNNIAKHTITELPPWKETKDNKKPKLMVDLHNVVTLDGEKLVAKPISA